MVKQTIKDFLLYLCLGAVIILSINTFIMVQNQTKMLNNQEKGLPIVNDTNQKIKDIDNRLVNLYEKIK
jgi:hypothetical protein